MAEFNISTVFDNDFFAGEVEQKGTEVCRKKVGEQTYVIRAENSDVANEQRIKLLESMDLAFGWEKMVLDGKAREMFWKRGEITLTLRDKMEGLMQNNFDIKAKYALGKSKETVAAAMFHEIVEMWRDEFGLIGEGAPLMAEFLMCGSDRLLFQELCDNFGNDDDSHQIGWNKVVNYLGFGKSGSKKLFTEMSEWKNGMNDNQKMEFIKNNLLEWKQR